MEPEYTYYAFISYSHRDDAFAKRLHHYLEHYRLPSRLSHGHENLPKALRPIFRDDSDLAIGQLSEMLREALATSRYLIVICSENSVRPNADGKNWIDEEVRMFLELHRASGGAKRVLPIILREEGGASAEDCLLPIIRERNIVAADVLDKGEERAMNDIIAKMLGIEPHELWKRFLRARKAQRFRRSLAGGLACALVAAAGWSSWDYYVPHLSYYADYVERDNVPQGLHELTEEQIRTQHRYYRFTTRKHHLRRVEHCNSAGHLQEHEHEWHRERSAAMELEYGEDGELARCIHRNAQGKELVVRKFAPGTVDFVQTVNADGVEGEVTRATPRSASHSVPADNTPPRNFVGRHLVQRESEGAQSGLISREFYCHMGSFHPMRDDWGRGGLEYKRDALGRPVELRYIVASRLDVPKPEAIPMTTAANIAGYDLSYGEHGRVTRITYLRGEEAGEDRRHSEIRISYDAQGRPVEIAHVDAEGKPQPGADGASRTTRRYDAQGNMVESACFDTEGNACLNMEGYSRRCLRYDERGYVVETMDYGVDGSPCYNKQGYARRQMQYDERGNVTQIATFAPDGQPCFTHRGYARVSLRYDERGNRVEISCFDKEGQPCCVQAGFARMSMSYDAQGNCTGESFFGTDGLPCTPADGVARRSRQHDERGNIVEETCYDANGKPCLNPEGCATCLMFYDERGKLSEKMFLGVDGNPILCKDSYARMTIHYNETDNSVDEFFYDAEDTPCLNNRGYAGVKRCYDERGVLSSEHYMGKNGRPCLNAEGVMQAWHLYDCNGRLSTTYYRDDNGRSLNNNEGYARVKHRYDERGNCIETLYENADGMPVNTREGYARMMAEYDARNNLQLVSYYNAQDELTPCRDGYACILRSYDERDNPIEEACYNTQGELCLIPAGYASLQHRYNERNERVETTAYDADNKPLQQIRE